jgi:hypothetical protein
MGPTFHPHVRGVIDLFRRVHTSAHSWPPAGASSGDGEPNARDRRCPSGARARTMKSNSTQTRSRARGIN